MLPTVFEVAQDGKTKLNNMTLNMLKIVIRDKFCGEIFANNTQSGFMLKIEINSNKALLGISNG